MSGSAIHVVTGFRRRVGMSAEEHARYLREVHAPMAREMPGLRGYVLSFPEREGPWDAVVQLWFDDSAAMDAAFASPAGRRGLADMAAFIDLESVQSQRFRDEVVVAPPPAAPRIAGRRATVVYMPGRGKAEILRILLAAGGWDWDEESPRDMVHYQALRGETRHGIIPFLRVVDGEATLVLEQSSAIEAYLARAAGLYPHDEPGRYRAEMIQSLATDLRTPMIFSPFRPDPEGALEAIETTTAPRFLPTFQALLSEAPGQRYLIDDRLTVADLTTFDVLDFLDGLLPRALDPYPRLREFHSRIAAHPPVAAYLASPRRHGMPDAAYVAHVLRFMG